MTEYDNNMRGVLFKNNDKQNDKSPDYKGQAEVDGQEFWLSAWIKEGKKCKFMSLSFKPKEEKPKSPKPKQENKPATAEEFENSVTGGGDELPFFDNL